MEALQRLHNRGSISTGYDIDNSCKFESDNTEYLSKTPSSAGNRRTWTFSAWVKRSEITATSNATGNQNMVFSAGDTYLQFDGNAIWINHRAASENFFLATNRLFRDSSAWYHIVWQLDTTDSTAADRAKLYINGVRETSFQNSTYDNMSLNYEAAVNNTVEHEIGKYSLHDTTYAGMFNGYMAEIHLVDGTALTPTSFGEFDSDSGIWKPKAYTGSHGTNGFYLDFSDSANLGDDASGNGNNFTETNITSADQATDTPTNNFCTMNMLDRTNGNSKNQEGATKVTTDGGSGWCSMVATMGVTKGKWYWETQRSGGSGDSHDVVTGIVGSEDAYIPYSSAAQYYIGNVATSSSIGFYTTGSPNVKNGDGGSLSNSPGDIIMIGLDMDNSKIYFGVNGTWDALGTGGSSLHADFDGEFVLPAVAVYQGKQIKINFGGYASYTISSAASDADGYGTFEYAPPSGYYALCTKNLAEYG